MRIFVAISLNDELKKNINNWKEKLEPKLYGKIKWVETQNYHITVHFFKDFKEANLSDLKNDLEENLKDIKPFNIKLKGLEFIPSVDQPRLIWVNLLDGCNEVKNLYKRTKDIAAKFGTFESREFVPHITIARIKDHIKIDKTLNVEHIKELEGRKMLVNNLSIFESKTLEIGPVYTLKHTIILK